MPDAFVAMRFTRHAQDDPTYQRMRKALMEAGYSVTRADEIRTSGPVVEEICKRLRESELVVLDSTGDSHSVSYEIGYCHGIGREPSRTLLLRRAPSDIPFNYRHFRHRTYKSLPALEQEIRAFIGLSPEIAGSTLANTITFEIPPRFALPLMKVELSILRAARDFRLSGRLETYISHGYLDVVEHDGIRQASIRRTPTKWLKLFILNIAFVPSDGSAWTLRELGDFGASVARKLARTVFKTRGAANLSEFNPVKGVRRSFDRFITCELRAGKVTRKLFNPSSMK